MISVAGDVDVIHPDLGSSLNTDGVTRRSENFGDLNVADDDIRLVEDSKSNTDERYTKSALSRRNG